MQGLQGSCVVVVWENFLKFPRILGNKKNHQMVWETENLTLTVMGIMLPHVSTVVLWWFAQQTNIIHNTARFITTSVPLIWS